MIRFEYDLERGVIFLPPPFVIHKTRHSEVNVDRTEESYCLVIQSLT